MGLKREGKGLGIDSKGVGLGLTDFWHVVMHGVIDRTRSELTARVSGIMVMLLSCVGHKTCGVKNRNT